MEHRILFSPLRTSYIARACV